ncbi:hypothetical protein Tco_0198772 [Tanacetum coccineum]
MITMIRAITRLEYIWTRSLNCECKDMSRMPYYLQSTLYLNDNEAFFFLHLIGWMIESHFNKLILSYKCQREWVERSFDQRKLCAKRCELKIYTGSDINTMPYRIYETLGREYMKKIDRGITMINHTQAEAVRKLSNVLCQVGVTTIIEKFLILDIPIDRDAPIVVGQGFLYTMGSILNTPERLFSTIDEVCHQNFRTTRFDVLRTAESDRGGICDQEE